MGIALFAAGQFDKALKVFADALFIWQELNPDRSGRGGVTDAINNVGATRFALNDALAAIEAFEEALQVYRSTLLQKEDGTDRKGEAETEGTLLSIAKTLCNLGVVELSLNEHENAKIVFEEAFQIQRTVLGIMDDCTVATSDLLVHARHSIENGKIPKEESIQSTIDVQA